VSTSYLLAGVLDLPKERQNLAHTKRLAQAMRRIGWHKPDQVLRIGKEVKHGFKRPMEAKSEV
jgi:hypothetical protein